ncbi:patatin-like phospholipase domain-containing protein 4 isoform X2 [Apostichopus japonicus]|uniref:patatin-like phospholipase domain-containing protein 4 isoform X2 n=1 Tax=Stichopus japonicus TaxID=307972 RepID=UPI003AB6DEA5
MNLLLKNLCREALTQTSRSVTTVTGQQNKWIDLCLGNYCTRKRSRIVASYGFPCRPNISFKVRLLCEGANRRDTGLLEKTKNDEHLPDHREGFDVSPSSDSAALHPSSSEREAVKRGKHVCMADHNPMVLNDTYDHCLRCQGTFEKLTEVSEINMTLAGCGFLGTYYLGVYEVLKRNGGSMFNKIRRWGGASAGAISAALITCYPDNPWIGMTVAQSMIEGTRKKLLGVFSPSFKLSEILHDQLEEHLPKNAHELANGNLYISVTNCTSFKNEIITEFASREELIEKYIDGGLTHNLPVYPFSGSTIFVSPFSGCQHICPKDENRYSFFVDLSGHRFKLNGQNIRRGLHGFLSPSEDTFMKYYEVGVKDTTEFLKENDCYNETVETDENENQDYDISKEDEVERQGAKPPTWDDEAGSR